MAIDGVVLDVPDTPDNVERFDKSEHRDGTSAFPQVRIVGLAECGTHAIVAAALDSWRTYERALTDRLLPQFRPDMLVLADRASKPTCSCRCSPSFPTAPTCRSFYPDNSRKT
jgi:hypothetical protein